MSRKTLDIAGIQNELEGGSAFFPSREPALEQAAPALAKKPATARKQPSTTRKQVQRQTADKPTTGLDTTTQPRYRDTTTPRHHDTTVSSMVEAVRRAVKQVGKEAATHRFTAEEKRVIADIIYTYGRHGYKTSENEIARIAINWLLWDYEQHGAQSVLAEVIKALRE
jgi:hypothetical protein